MVSSLKVTSLQSPNTHDICRRITRYLGERLGISTDFLVDRPWQERERVFDQGEIHISWICGLPYVRKVERDPQTIELVAAPVLNRPRYRKRPVYFSDVVVHRTSEITSFRELRGCCWAYNEPGSHSGYNVTCFQLAEMGEKADYFGQIVEAGSHLRALEWVVDGEIDAAAIDSMVLETEFQSRPTLENHIRIIETWGPSPMPPWVMRREIDPTLREQIRHIFMTMHEDKEGRTILRQGQVMKMAQVTDADYDPIRKMARKAQEVQL